MAIEGMAAAFGGKTEVKPSASEVEMGRLQTKIGVANRVRLGCLHVRCDGKVSCWPMFSFHPPDRHLEVAHLEAGSGADVRAVE